MIMRVYSYYNKLRKRFENIFLAETDEDIVYSIEREANRITKESQALREKLETVDLVYLGTFNQSDGKLTPDENKVLKLTVNPVKPIDGIEKTVTENSD